MSFGFQVFSSTGELQLDSTRTGDQALTVVASGSGSTIAYTPPVGVTPIVFANVSVSSGNYDFFGFDGTTFRNFDATAKVVNYVVCVRTNDIDPADKVGDYGLQVFNADGDEQFDSRYYNGAGGFGVLGYFPRLSIQSTAFASTGYIFETGGATNNAVTTNVDHYVTLSVGSFIPYTPGQVGTPAFTGYFVANNFNITSGTNTNEFTGSNSPAPNQVYTGIYPYRIRGTPKTADSFNWLDNFVDTLYGEKF